MKIKIAIKADSKMYQTEEREAFEGLTGTASDEAMNKGGETEVLVTFDKPVQVGERTLTEFWFGSRDLVKRRVVL
jgi:hypothetical protein